MGECFKGKVYAITGGASGIGLACVHALLSRGAKVSIGDVQESLMQDIAREVDPAMLHVQKTDVRKRKDVEDWLTQTVDKFGRLDGAANLAGVIPRSHNISTLVDQDDDEWDFVFDVNVRGVMNCMRAQIPRIGNVGSIVNAGSALSLQGRGAAAAYAASKHAVVGLTRSVAKEVGTKGIRVNCIAPGYVMTPMMGNALDNMTDASQENPSATALARFGQPKEVADLILFLLGEKSSFVTGATICIDGGWNC